MNKNALHLFDAYGIELEYMIVDRASLDVQPICDELLKSDAGEIRSEIERGPLAWSNELTLHVVELKTNGPAETLSGLAQAFQQDVQEINNKLTPFGACLLPSAAHPWMDPDREMRLWPHDYSPIYEAYDRIFDCRGHGWANLQSVHINLPFCGDEFARLHAAIRLVLPILPALAASSPFLDGKTTGFRDTRLNVYRHNSNRVPLVSGKVIPEPAYSHAEYDRMIFQPLYQAIAPLDPDKLLQEEFLNARGAIARFDRNAIEIRLLDIQECPAADLAICAAVIAVVRSLCDEKWSSLENQKGADTDRLSTLLDLCVRDAENATLDEPEYLKLFGIEEATISAGALWRRLIEQIELPAGDRAILEEILAMGTLSSRILRASGDVPSRERLQQVTESWRSVWRKEKCSVPTICWNERVTMQPIITCEHGGNHIPAEYATLFRAVKEQLDSHRGWDPGTLVFGRKLAEKLSAPLIASETSRLLVDLNRSVKHPRLFSEWTRALPEETRQQILKTYYLPHRAQVSQEISQLVANKKTVLHLGIHSFTPVLDGVPRTTDIGLLYDPARDRERDFCQRLKRELSRRLPELRIHKNRPYRGVSDGLTTSLRKQFSSKSYLGIELEINQRFPLGDKRKWQMLQTSFIEAISETLAH